jgi:hypothetical protein
VLLIYSLVIIALLRPQPRSVSSRGQSKTKSCTLKQSRRGNRTRTGSRSSTSSPSDNTQITEAVANAKDGEQSLIFRKPHDSIQQSDILREPRSYPKSETLTSPDHSFPQPPSQGYPPTSFLPPITALCTASETRFYPAKPDARLPEKAQSPPFLGTRPTQMAVSLGRIEDISIMSNTKSTRQNGTLDQGGAQSYVRFQYSIAP